MSKILKLIISLSISLFIITSIVIFTVKWKTLYYFDIDYLNIPKLSNMTKEDIRLNYDYLIEYNTKDRDVEFELPTLKSSTEGKIHFEEVREIFQNIELINIITGIISIIGIFICIKSKDIKMLKSIGITLISIPLFLMIPVIMNFEVSFKLFHEILFDNDYWIFNPSVDPVINMLPAEFFLHAGIMILSLILISSIVCIVIYNILLKKE